MLESLLSLKFSLITLQAPTAKTFLTCRQLYGANVPRLGQNQVLEEKLEQGPLVLKNACSPIKDVSLDELKQYLFVEPDEWGNQHIYYRGSSCIFTLCFDRLRIANIQNHILQNQTRCTEPTLRKSCGQRIMHIYSATTNGKTSSRGYRTW